MMSQISMLRAQSSFCKEPSVAFSAEIEKIATSSTQFTRLIVAIADSEVYISIHINLFEKK